MKQRLRSRAIKTATKQHWSRVHDSVNRPRLRPYFGKLLVDNELVDTLWVLELKSRVFESTTSPPSKENQT